MISCGRTGMRRRGSRCRKGYCEWGSLLLFMILKMRRGVAGMPGRMGVIISRGICIRGYASTGWGSRVYNFPASILAGSMRYCPRSDSSRERYPSIRGWSRMYLRSCRRQDASAGRRAFFRSDKSIHFLFQRGDLILQVADEVSQLVDVPPVLGIGFTDDHLRFPDFQDIFGVDIIGLVCRIVTDEGKFVPGFVVLHDPLVDDAFVTGDDNVGLVAFDFFEVVDLFADDDGAAGCRQHGVADDLECAIVAGSKHREGKGIEFVQEFGVGVTGEVA